MRAVRIIAVGSAVFGAALVAVAGPVGAQTFPTKPVRVIVPFGTGGGSDTVGRFMAGLLSERFGQQFFVENRAGAGALIGTAALVKSAPDGYTIMVSSSSWVTSSAVYAPQPDPVPAIAPIAEIGFQPLVLVVHPSLPTRTTSDLLALARSRPGDLACATPGFGSITHLATELFLSTAGARMVSVPYKSGGAPMPDLITGQIQVMLGGLSNVHAVLSTGKLRGLGVSSRSRWSSLPDLPTLSETLPGFAVESWFGAVAPKGISGDAVQLLNAAINELLRDAKNRKRLFDLGLQANAGSAAQLAARVEGDYDRWKKVVQQANIKPAR